MAPSTRSVGFVVDANLPSFGVGALLRLGPLSPFRGVSGSTAMGEMRYGWVATEVNRRPEFGLRYELYRPFRQYDALVFVKSMTPACLQLAGEYQAKGRPALFEINVNYFQAEGTFYYDGMKPTPEQQENAIAMARACDGVISASCAIEEASSEYNQHTVSIPDNVNTELLPPDRSAAPPGKRLRLLWSGQAPKLFDLLSIEDVLRQFRKNLELVLITTDLSALDRIYEPYRTRLLKLMSDLECRIIPYESISHLMQVYGESGVVISPRFLDSSYNRGHTEWKITLGMACGRVSLCSPQRSYVEVSKLSRGKGIRICEKSSDWGTVFDAMLSGKFEWEGEQHAAERAVADNYSTEVVARRHARFVADALESGTGN